MAYDIGPKIGIDGEAEFRAALKTIASQAKTLGAEMKAVTSAFDKNDKSEKALTAQSEVLTKQIQLQKDKLELQNKALEEARKKFGDADDATQRWQQVVYNSTAELNKLERKLAEAEKGLKDLASEATQAGSAMDSGEDDVKKLEKAAGKAASSTDDLGNAMNNAKSDAASFGDVLRADLIADGLTALTDAIGGVIDETKDYRKIMGSLEVSSQGAGYSAEETAEAYRELYGVLADEQSAATTTANLQAIGLEQEDLQSIIDSTIGAWAKYGDSIPIDGLAESINETIRCGTVTGNFADVLNWGSKEGETFGVMLKDNTEANKDWNDAVNDAVTAEDYFNLALQQCQTDAERANLVLQYMASQGLADAGQAWQDNNQSMVEANQAAADVQDQLATMGEKFEPVSTAIQEGFSDILTSINEVLDGIDMEEIAGSVKEAIDGIIDKTDELISGVDWDALKTNAGKIAEAFGEAATKAEDFGSYLIDNQETVIAAVAGIGAAFATWKIASTIQGAFIAISTFVNGAGGFAAAIGALANPLGIAAAAIGIVAGGFVLAYQNSEEFRDIVSAAMDVAKEAIDRVAQVFEFFFGLISPIVDALKESLKPAFEKLQESLGPLKDIFEKLIPIFEVIAAFLGSTLVVAITVASGALSGFINFIATAFSGLVEVINGIVDIVSSVIEVIVGIFTLDGEKIVDGAKGIVDGVIEVVSGLWEGTVGAVSDFVGGTIGYFTDLYDELVGHSIVPDTVDEIAGCFGGLWGDTQGSIGTFQNGVTGSFESILSAGGNDFSDLKKSVSNSAVALKTSVLQTFNLIKSSTQGIFSGLQKSVSNSAAALKTSVLRTFNLMKSSTQGVFSGLKTIATGAFSSMKNAISSQISSIKSTITSGLEKAVSYLKNLPSKAYTWGKDFIDGLKRGIKSAIDGVINTVSNMASSIRGMIHFSRPDYGPLRDYETWMPDFVDGLVRGIDANAWRLEEAVSRMAGNASVQLAGAPAGNSYNMGGVTIHVHAASGQSEDAIANSVMKKMQNLYSRKRSVYR